LTNRVESVTVVAVEFGRTMKAIYAIEFLDYPGDYFSFRQLREIQKMYEDNFSRGEIIQNFLEKYPESDRELTPAILSLLIDKLDS
jgi:hypothetical protein